MTPLAISLTINVILCPIALYFFYWYQIYKTGYENSQAVLKDYHKKYFRMVALAKHLRIYTQNLVKRLNEVKKDAEEGKSKVCPDQ